MLCNAITCALVSESYPQDFHRATRAMCAVRMRIDLMEGAFLSIHVSVCLFCFVWLAGDRCGSVGCCLVAEMGKAGGRKRLSAGRGIEEAMTGRGDVSAKNLKFYLTTTHHNSNLNT